MWCISRALQCGAVGYDCTNSGPARAAVSPVCMTVDESEPDIVVAKDGAPAPAVPSVVDEMDG